MRDLENLRELRDLSDLSDLRDLSDLSDLRDLSDLSDLRVRSTFVVVLGRSEVSMSDRFFAEFTLSPSPCSRTGFVEGRRMTMWPSK